MNRIPDAALLQHIIALGKTGSGKSSALRSILEGQLLDRGIPVCILDPKGDWWGLKSHYSVVIFGGEHADVPIGPGSGAAAAEFVVETNLSCIFDMGALSMGERTRFFVEFAQALFRTTKGTRILLIDECHNFAPQGKVLDPESGKMLHWANRLASEGRGKGITILAASQRPQKVHKDFLTSMETLIAMRVIHVRDREAIKDWLDGAGDKTKAAEIMAGLAQMPRGTGWVWSPEIDYGPVMVKFPMFKSYDSFAPQGAPAIFKPKAVTLDVVREKFQALIQEQKASDPKELRRQLVHANTRLKQLEQEALLRPLNLEVSRDELRTEYERGRQHGAAQVTKRLNALLEMLDDLHKVIGRAREKTGEAIEAVAEDMPPVSLRAPVQAVIQKTAPIVQKSVQKAAPASAGNGRLSKAERSILTVLAQTGGRVSIRRVALTAGYAVSGGGFRNALSALRTAGLIEGSSNVSITPAGSDALGSYTPLPVGSELLAYWQTQLDRAGRSILGALHDHGEIDRAELARLTNYEENGGGFRNALSRLRTLELISGNRTIQLSEELR